jgi:hypothetical protein
MSSSPPAAESATPAASGGYGRLARRIGGWTANLLATAIVVVAGLGLGRQVLVWWNETTLPSAAATDAAAEKRLSPDVLPADLRLWTTRGPIEIARVYGDRDAVLTEMRHKCQSLDVGQSNPAEMGPGERRFLERLAKLAPVEQTNDLDLYAPDESVTMMVAVSRQRRRIAAWSFALPVEEAAWSCYTFGPAMSEPVPGSGTDLKETP